MIFEKKLVNFSGTNVLPKITEDYLSGNKRLLPFVNPLPDLDGFKEVISKRSSFPVNRTLLATILKEQNKDASELTLKNIELLKKDNAFTITTGQQLNLFTGPLFFIYKIISAIKLARSLSEKFSAQHFIPVYWMNGEDHDLKEINHTYIYGKKVEWKTEQKGATGRMLCKGIAEVIDEVETILGKNEANAELLALLKTAYKESNTLSESTKILVNALFSKYGLVIIDGDDARFKKEFSSIIKDDLLNQNAFKKVNETTKRLEADYEIQVHPREINLFYLTTDLRGRIVKEDNSWKVLNTSITWNEKDLMKEVEEHPEHFSPNVVLRPMYQEVLLPNIAYIGGPAEVAYWLEYKNMFEHYKVSYPVPLLRNCAMIVDDASVTRLSKLKIGAKQLFESGDELIKHYLHQKNDNGFSTIEESKQITSAYDELIKKIALTDASLVATAEIEKKKNLAALKVLEEKVIRAQKKNHETEIQQIQKLKEKFFPNKSFQERVENITPYSLKYGTKFLDELIDAFEPIGNNFIILTETKQKS